jgi:hypothetical protein
MTDSKPIEVTFRSQRVAAEAIEAEIQGGEELADALISEGTHAEVLSVTKTLRRSLAATLVQTSGLETALRICEATKLQAALAEVPDDPDDQ